MSDKKCPHYKKCGGCQLMNMSYPDQLMFKQRRTISYLGKFAHVSDIIGMDDPYHYRNKVQAAFGTDRHGNIISGVYQESTHHIIPVTTCLTEDLVADHIMGTVRTLMKGFHIDPYDERRCTGVIRHVLVRRGFATGQVMAVIVAATPVFPAKKFAEQLVKSEPCINTVVLNINDKFTSMVLGDRTQTLYGDGYITDILCGLTFRISAKSFYQINPVQCEVLYKTAADFAQFDKRDIVYDAYCGIGTIGLTASKHVRRVVGIELNTDAAKDAVQNALINNISNADFVCADAAEYFEQSVRAEKRPDVVMMDPPRSGSSPRFLSALSKMQPSRIIYISCNPETQARDLLFLCKRGYKVRKIQPVDMFPHTNHVETVVALTK